MSAAELSYKHVTPAFRVLSGERALDALSGELKRAAQERVVIIGSRSVLNDEVAMARIRSALGARIVAEFDGVVEHSPLPAVERAKDELIRARADCVITVGGGSAIVTARAATILLAEGSDVRELATHRDESGTLVSPRLNAPKLPIWIIPSTPTTAYAKAGSAVRDPHTGERLPLYDPKTRAHGVVFDPVLASTAPASLVRSAALNALSLAVEGLQAEGVDPLADALLAHALRLCLDWVGRIDTHQEARLHLMTAALLAGQGSDFVRGGLAQGLSHIIGPRSEVANGVVEAMLLPASLELEAQLTDSTAYALLARVLGSEDARVPAVAQTLRSALAALNIPGRLRNVGVAQGSLAELATLAKNDWAIASRAQPPTEASLVELLQRCW